MILGEQFKAEILRFFGAHEKIAITRHEAQRNAALSGLRRDLLDRLLGAIGRIDADKEIKQIAGDNQFIAAAQLFSKGAQRRRQIRG